MTMDRIPEIGKISPQVFEQLILPRLGAKSNQILVGPQNGVDVGIVNKTTEVSRGVMWGIVGLANDFQGVQSHWVSISKGKFEGWQMGHVNISDTFRGFQSGLVNVANADAEGLQLSLLNYAKKFTGLQIGLVNIIEEGGMLLGTGGD